MTDKFSQDTDHLIAPVIGDHEECHVQTENLGNPNPGKIKVLGFQVPLQVLNTFLAVATVVTNIGQLVSLPLYAKAVDQSGSDSYNVLLFSSFWFPWIFLATGVLQKYLSEPDLCLFPWHQKKFIFIAGLMTSFNGLLVVFTSDPARTPAYLQGILMTFSIPYTVIARLILLRKGVSLRRAVCTGIVVIGVFITLEPQIWNLDGSSSSEAKSHSVFLRILYPLLFAISFVPAAVVNVVWEKEMKEEESGSVVFIGWSNFVQFFVLLFCWWSDFIPAMGMTNSIGEFREHLSRGFHCHFSSDSSCNGVAGLAWFFIFTYVTGNLLSLLLVKYAEGAVYMVMVTALTTPLATIFWSFFTAEPFFAWMPRFTITTAFTLVGLVIMTPAVVMYNIFSMQDQEIEEKKEKEREIETEIIY